MARKVFDDIYDATARQEEFKDKHWGDGSRGCPTQPLLKKVDAAVFIITKAASYTTAAAAAGLGTSTVQHFFPKWVAWLRKEMVPLHVFMPSPTAIQHMMGVYAGMGFPGACCSTDGVHVLWLKCPISQKQVNKGEKGFPVPCVQHQCWTEH